MRAKLIYEAIEDILKPKSSDEIMSDIINLINHSPDLMSVSFFIESGLTNGLGRELKSEVEKLCELMNSNPKDVYFLTENDNDYEIINKVLYKIYLNTLFDKDNNTLAKRFTAKKFEYVINPISKITYANWYDLSIEVSAIFFNRPYVLKILRNTKSWEF
jgi:hypothetical protein